MLGNVDSIIQSAQNRLYLNDGTGRFTDATATQMPVDSDRTTSVRSATSTATATSTWSSGNEFWGGSRTALYLNDGTGTFTDATRQR